LEKEIHLLKSKLIHFRLKPTAIKKKAKREAIFLLEIPLSSDYTMIKMERKNSVQRIKK